MKHTLTLLLLLYIGTVGWAQSEIAIYSGTASPSAVAATNASATPLSRGAGLVAESGPTFNSSDWSSLGFVDPATSTDYIEWSIMADPGFVVTVEEVQLNYGKSPNGPPNITLRSSLNNYVTSYYDDGSVTGNKTQTVVLSTPQVSAAGGTITFRLYGFNTSDINGTFDIKGGLTPTSLTLANVGIRLLGSVEAANDLTSEVVSPTSQIASQSIAPGTAEDVISFTIEDKGSEDGLPTEVTRMRLVPGASNTADWTDHIQDISSLDVGGTTVTPASVIISDTEIIMDITAGDIVVVDGASELVTVGIQLNSTNCEDGAILNFEVPGSSHGFQSDLIAGSGFADPFPGGGVSGNDHTITVTATELRFAQQPTSTVVDQAMSPAVTVEATDADGNRDVDITSDIELTSTGTLVGDPVTIAAVNGLATFSGLTHSATGTVLTLTADGAGLTSATSNSFDIVTGPCTITALGNESYTCATNTAGADNDMVTVDIPYTGVDANAVLAITVASAGASNNGDDPTTDTDGTISFDANEGDSWSVTITGGTCNFSASGTVPSMECDPLPDVVINEILPAPNSDVNGDGTTDSGDDEFIELYNNGISAADLNGWEIRSDGGLRHTFPAGTTLAPGEGLVVFGGGGTPSGIPITSQTASSGTLSFNDAGSNVKLEDDAGNQIDAHSYSSSTSDVSWARSPDFTGGFVLHTSITGNSVNYSTGRANTSNAALPITLHSFTATAAGSLAQLHWRTATELNNDYMAVEHSTDGRHYTEIGQVAGAGTTQLPQDYYFTHTSPAAGLNYYRLRQVDYDGQYEYHGPVSLRLGRVEAELRLYPSPAHSSLTLDFQASRQEEGEFLLFDAYGRQLRRIPHTGGPIRQTIEVESLPAGTYTLLWAARGEAPVAARFVKE